MTIKINRTCPKTGEKTSIEYASDNTDVKAAVADVTTGHKWTSDNTFVDAFGRECAVSVIG